MVLKVELESIKARMDGITVVEKDSPPANADLRRGTLQHYGGDQTDVLVLGDSHALMWAPVIDEICKELNQTVLFYLADGVPALPSIPARRREVVAFSPEQWLAFDSNRMRLIKELQPRLVIVASRWKFFAINDDTERFFAEVARQGLKLLLIDDPPELAIGDVNAPKFATTTSATTVKADNLEDQQHSTALLRALATELDNVSVVETADLYLTADNRVKLREGNSILYIDDDHLSLAGARLSKGRITTAMSRLLQLPH